jgi:tRNA-splicing ligase RtcB
MTEHSAFTVLKDDGMKVPVKVWGHDLMDQNTLKQVKQLAGLPFIHSHLALMPDGHVGIGSTVGSVIPTQGAVIPAAVGVDIGCGMIWQRTSLRAEDLPDNLLGLRTEIEERIPHGRTNNGGPGDRGAWGEPRAIARGKMMWMQEGLDKIVAKLPKIERAAKGAINHLGTLGGGNHFVEVVIDDEGYVGIVVHSGSRGIGNQIGQRYIELAKEDMRRYHINLPDTDLSYLPEGTQHFDDYLFAVSWAQNFAMANRQIMMLAAVAALTKTCGDFQLTQHAVNCHHNYVATERWGGKDTYVTRKGAVSAKLDELGIIPGSMGAKSFIVKGKGNRESFCSCSHGAGRSMSRTEAKRRFTVEDHIAATAGIECRKDADVVDETPAAYKDIDAVMLAQADLIEVVRTLKQVVCVKG